MISNNYSSPSFGNLQIVEKFAGKSVTKPLIANLTADNGIWQFAHTYAPAPSVPRVLTESESSKIFSKIKEMTGIDKLFTNSSKKWITNLDGDHIEISNIKPGTTPESVEQIHKVLEFNLDK